MQLCDCQNLSRQFLNAFSDGTQRTTASNNSAVTETDSMQLNISYLSQRNMQKRYRLSAAPPAKSTTVRNRCIW